MKSPRAVKRNPFEIMRDRHKGSSDGRAAMMKSYNVVVNRVLYQFRALGKALIDASSIIYMDKAGFLVNVAKAIELYSPEEILAETGLRGLLVHPIHLADKSLPNDQKLIACALMQQLPVISEDQKILLRLEREKTPYFNALMMLNYLLFKKDISSDQHRMFFQSLIRCSWYSRQVLAFSNKVYDCIVNRNSERVSRSDLTAPAKVLRQAMFNHADGL